MMLLSGPGRRFRKVSYDVYSNYQTNTRRYYFYLTYLQNYLNEQVILLSVWKVML